MRLNKEDIYAYLVVLSEKKSIRRGQLFSIQRSAAPTIPIETFQVLLPMIHLLVAVDWADNNNQPWMDNTKGSTTTVQCDCNKVEL